MIRKIVLMAALAAPMTLAGMALPTSAEAQYYGPPRHEWGGPPPSYGWRPPPPPIWRQPPPPRCWTETRRVWVEWPYPHWERRSVERCAPAFRRW